MYAVCTYVVRMRSAVYVLHIAYTFLFSLYEKKKFYFFFLLKYIAIFFTLKKKKQREENIIKRM